MRRVLAFARACPATSPPIPCAAAALVPVPAVLRTPRARLVPRLERHKSGAHPDRGQSDGPARSRIAAMPTALLRRPKRARAMLIPVYDADARLPSPAPRRSKTTSSPKKRRLSSRAPKTRRLSSRSPKTRRLSSRSPPAAHQCRRSRSFRRSPPRRRAPGILRLASADPLTRPASLRRASRSTRLASRRRPSRTFARSSR